MAKPNTNITVNNKSTDYWVLVLPSVLPACGRHYSHFIKWDTEWNPVRKSKFSKAA